MYSNQLLTMMYDLAIVASGERDVNSFIKNTLSRLLYHTSFPAGVYISINNDKDGQAKLECVIGKKSFKEKAGRDIPLSALLTDPKAHIVQDKESIHSVFKEDIDYGVMICLPAMGKGIFLLFGNTLPTLPFPVEQVFLPVLENFSRTLSLLQQNETLVGVLREEADKYKKISEEINEVRNMQQIAINAAPARMFWKDKDLKYLGCNQIFAEDAGLKNPEEIAGKSDFDLVWTEQAELYRNDDRAVMASGIARLNYVEPQTRPDGTTSWLETSKVPLTNSNGEIIGVMGTYRDITERMKMESSLKKSEASLRRAQKIAHIGNWEWDLLTNVLFWSDECYRIFGIDPDEHKELTLEKFYSMIYPRDLNEVKAAIRKSIDGRLPYKVEHRMVTPGGELRSVEEQGELVFNEQNVPVKMVGTVQDISERVKAREELDLYRLMIENSGDPVFLIDNEAGGKMIYVNEPARKHFDAPLKEIYSWKIPDWDPLFDINKLDSFTENLKKKMNIQLESVHQIKSGKLVPVELSLNYIHYKGRDCCFGYFKDISERKKIEEELNDSRNTLLKAQQIANMGNWIWDMRTNDLVWSEQIFRIFKLTPENCVPTYELFLKYIHPDDRNLVTEAIKKTVEDGLPYSVDHRVVRDDGSIIYVTESGELEKDKSGNAVRMHGVVLDITDRKKTQEDLELYRFMIENSGDPTFLIDDDDNCKMIYVNEAARKHFGTSLEEIYSWRIPDWDPNFTYDKLPQHVEEIKKIKNLNIETVHRLKNGDLVPVEISLNVIKYKGKLCHFGYFKNISERKRTEEELKTAKLAAETANRAKSEFLANMSHEIRTPMNAILGFTEILSGKVVEPEYLRYLKSISTAGKSLLTIINDILDLSKIEAGKMVLEYSNVYLENIMDDLHHLFSGKVTEKGIDLVIPQHTFPDTLLMDETRLRQVMINLVGNAIKFTDRGYVKVDCTYEPSGISKVDLVITIEDTGIGIPRDQQEGIFEAFRQREGQKQTKYGGTGLGLSISNRLVKMMGGELTLESEEGKGSKFIVTLRNIPIGTNVLAKADDEMVYSDIHFKSSRILVVDDVKDNRELIKVYLEYPELELDFAENGQIALDKVDENKPDLILMDLRMPVMDGYEAIRQLKENQETKDIPVIVLTASLMEHSEEEVKKNNAGYLRKPVNRRDLLNLLMRFLPYETSKKVEDVVIKTVNHLESITDIRELADVLEKELQPAWENVRHGLEFGKIEEFAHMTIAIAEKYNDTALKSWGESISQSAMAFDVREIKKEIEQFPEYIKRLK